VLLLEGLQTDITAVKRGFPSKKQLASHVLCSSRDMGAWLSKPKAETRHFRRVLGLRKPSLPSLAAVHCAVTLLSPLRSKQPFYQLFCQSSPLQPHKGWLWFTHFPKNY